MRRNGPRVHLRHVRSPTARRRSTSPRGRTCEARSADSPGRTLWSSSPITNHRTSAPPRSRRPRSSPFATPTPGRRPNRDASAETGSPASRPARRGRASARAATTAPPYPRRRPHVRASRAADAKHDADRDVGVRAATPDDLSTLVRSSSDVPAEPCHLHHWYSPRPPAAAPQPGPEKQATYARNARVADGDQDEQRQRHTIPRGRC